MKLYYQIDCPYHLCPVCGLPSTTTSRVCPKHVSITYDLNGNVVCYTDYILDWDGVLRKQWN